MKALQKLWIKNDSMVFLAWILKNLVARSFHVKKVWGHAPPTIFHLDAPGVVNHHGPPHMILLTTALDQKVWHNRG